MRKRKDTDLELEEYIDDEYFYSVDKKQEKMSEEEEEYKNFFKVEEDEDTDYSYDVPLADDESNYNDFIKIREYDDSDDEDDDDEDEEEDIKRYNEKNGIMYYLGLFLTWFRYIGIAIAVVLIAVFISQGKMKTLLLYILGLVAAFFFGYFFMFLLNKFTEE